MESISNSDPSTLNVVPGLCIGEKVSAVEPIEGSSSSQNDVSIDNLVNPSSQVMVSPQPNEYLCQPSVETNVSDSTARITENQPLTALYFEPVISSTVSQSNDGLELSTLDGPSGLLIGENTLMEEPTLVRSTQLLPTLAELSAKKLRIMQSLITSVTTGVDCQQVTGSEASNSLLTQAQLLRADGDLELDESVLLFDNTQDYSTHEGPSGLSFGEILNTVI